MPIRNPFARRLGVAVTPVITTSQDEIAHPETLEQDPSHPGFERVDTVGSKASSVLSIKSNKSQDNGEYKMSVVNDSGVYLPPSPTEETAVWPRRYLSRTSTDTRSSSGDIEHFSISRESFDSYRRSFDICAKSPVIGQDAPTRQSLDSARFARMPRSAIGDRRVDREPPTAEERFEDVGLNDELQQQQQQLKQAAAHQQQQQQPRRRGFFSKFSESQEKEPVAIVSPTVSRFLLPNRKRTQSQSTQGAEMVERPTTATPTEASLHVQEVH